MLITDIIDKKLAINEISDELILKLSYGIRYFELYGKYATPEIFDYWNKIQRELICRLDIIEKKTSQKKVLKKFELKTQLWEECICGKQPIYAETNLCLECSRK